MVFELVPFLACTTAAGALGTGAWYVAVKEYGPSNGTYRANPKRNRNEQGKDDSNLESRCDAVDGADSDSIRDYGVGFDLIRLSSGNYAIKSIKPGFEKSGVTSGDIILKVDQVDPSGMAMEDMHRLLVGPRNTPVEIELRAVSSGRIVKAVLDRSDPNPLLPTRSPYAPVPVFIPRAVN